jgi:transposase
LLTRQLAEVEADIAQQIKKDDSLHHQFTLLYTIPGVGPILAAHFLAEVPDVARFESASQLAAFAGLVPTQGESGTSVKRKSKLAKSGNVHLRKAFYMPALSAARHNPLIAAFVARLRAVGDKAKKAIVAAVMHKLLRLRSIVVTTLTGRKPRSKPPRLNLPWVKPRLLTIRSLRPCGGPMNYR